MTDPGLSNRLRQHSRRSGLMVGLSMAGAIAICVGGFVAIYAFSLPWVSDFVPLQAQERTPTPTPIVARNEPAAPAEAGPDPTSVLNAITAGQNRAAAPAAAPEATQAPEPTETPAAFEPDFQIQGTTVNFRSGGSREDPVIQALPPETPLQDLGETAPTDVPDDEPGWRKFRIQSGEEGWVREIDTEPYRE